MNKSIKILSLVLLASASFVSAEEAKQDEAKTVVKEYDTAEAIEAFIVKAYKDTVDTASDASEGAKQLSKKAINAIVEKVKKAAAADKKSYIKANIKSLVASLSSSDKEEESK